MEYLELDGPKEDDTNELIIVEPPSQLFIPSRRRRTPHSGEGDADHDDNLDQSDPASTPGSSTDTPPPRQTPAPKQPGPVAPPAVEQSTGTARRTGRRVLVLVLVVLVLVAWFVLLRDARADSAALLSEPHHVVTMAASSSAPAAATPTA